MPGLKIKEWNTADQPREKLIRFGAGHLTDAEPVSYTHLTLPTILLV